MTKDKVKGIALFVVILSGVMAAGTALIVTTVRDGTPPRATPTQLGSATSAIKKAAQGKLGPSISLQGGRCRYLVGGKPTDTGTGPLYVCTLKIAGQGQTACLGVVARWTTGVAVTFLQGQKLDSKYCGT